MGDVFSFITPLLLLPGAALMLVSTSPRYEALHAEIHHLVAEASEQAAMCAPHVLTRARLLRNALVLLYLACALFSASGLGAGVTSWWFGQTHPAAWALGGGGVVCVVLASLILVREAFVSLWIVEDHAKGILGE